MTPIQALILGLIQGLTEFLPVSSSGHLEIGKALFGLEMSGAQSLTFDVVVHAGTALSTIVVFRKDIAEIITGSIEIQMECGDKICEFRFDFNGTGSFYRISFRRRDRRII